MTDALRKQQAPGNCNCSNCNNAASVAAVAAVGRSLSSRVSLLPTLACVPRFGRLSVSRYRSFAVARCSAAQLSLNFISLYREEGSNFRRPLPSS